MHKHVPVVVLSLLAVLPAAGLSAQELVQEHFTLESPFLQERHELQLTLGSSWRRQNGIRERGIPAIIEFGLSDRLQLSTTLMFEDALDEIELGIMFSPLNDARTVALAAGLEAGFSPHGGPPEWTPVIAAARQVGPSQLVVAARRDADAAAGFDLGAALVVRAGPLRLMTEAAGLAGGAEGRSVTPGLAWTTSLGFEAAIGWSQPAGRGATARAFHLMLTYEREF